MSNFATFYHQSIKDRLKKTKKGRYKGQPKSLTTKTLREPGPAYHPQAQASKLNAPSASTYTVRG